MGQVPPLPPTYPAGGGGGLCYNGGLDLYPVCASLSRSLCTLLLRSANKKRNHSVMEQTAGWYVFGKKSFYLSFMLVSGATVVVVTRCCRG